MPAISGKIKEGTTLAFEIPQQKYSGAIKTVTIGKGDKAITLGGETSYPFYVFEGAMPNKLRIAMEVWGKKDPARIGPARRTKPSDVAKDPVAWAQKCVKEFGAEAIGLVLVKFDRRRTGWIGSPNPAGSGTFAGMLRNIRVVNLP